MTAKEVIAKDLEEIYIGNLNTVDTDLRLPKKGRNGAAFLWHSKEILFISHEGKVTRPTNGVGNRKVILEVCAKYQEETGQRTFEATVLEEPRRLEISGIEKVKAEAFSGERAELPPVIIAVEKNGDAITLPVVWEPYEPLEEGTLTISGAVEGIERKAIAYIQYTRERKTASAGDRRDELYSFGAGAVRLNPGSMFYEAAEQMSAFLKNTDADQMLYNFRQAAGLDTKGASPMTGWDAPECNLRGHTTGHYLSGLALAYCATGDRMLLNKISYLVEELKKCQDALKEKGWKEGFLSAYGEEQFDLLEKYTAYPAIWAPYYTLDKILSGLYDCYMLAGNQTALEILKKMGYWVYNRLSALPKEQRDRMWSMYIAGEFGGMIGSLVRLYQVTKEECYFQAAQYFSNEKLFYPMAQNRDTLKDMHANQHIPQILGALEMYRARGEKRYLQIAENFWQMVEQGHAYTIGGTGETEMFRGANHLADYLSDKTAESCATYNMLRLTSGLFRLEPVASRMDYYENGLYNHIMATASHTCDGGTTYFMPLRPGGQKEFGTDENTCCHGTGMESRFRYLEDLYMQNETEVYVNLYIPSTLKAADIRICQTEEKTGRYHFSVETEGERTLAFRKPVWAADFSVVIGGEVFKEAAEDGYIHIQRVWEEEEPVLVEAVCEYHVLKSPDAPEYASVAYGPYILAELSEEETWRELPELTHMEAHTEGRHLKFRCDGRSFIPLSDVCHEKYHVYFICK